MRYATSGDLNGDLNYCKPEGPFANSATQPLTASSPVGRGGRVNRPPNLYTCGETDKSGRVASSGVNVKEGCGARSWSTRGMGDGARESMTCYFTSFLFFLVWR